MIPQGLAPRLGANGVSKHVCIRYEERTNEKRHTLTGHFRDSLVQDVCNYAVNRNISRTCIR